MVEGNKLWQRAYKDGVSTSGRPELYTDPKKLWADCCEYFDWVEKNPLIEQRPFAFQGHITYADVEKMQAMTKGGLCIFLGIHHTTWMAWGAEGHKLRDVVLMVNEVILHQKITGAAADLLNPVIISREVGLADKQDHQSSDGSMTPTVITRTIVDPAE